MSRLIPATVCRCHFKFCMFSSSHRALKRVTRQASNSSYDFTLLTAALSLNMPPAGVPVYFPHGGPEHIAACHQRSRGFEPLSAEATCIWERRSNLHVSRFSLNVPPLPYLLTSSSCPPFPPRFPDVLAVRRESVLNSARPT